MNERIRELADEAAKFSAIMALPTGESGDKLFVKKFAELIVRECAGLFPNVYVEIENEYGHTPVVAADYIKKHFGVEK